MNIKERKAIIAGNWKLNKRVSDIPAFAQELQANLPAERCCDVVICAPYPLIGALEAAGQCCALGVGAQDAHAHAVEGGHPHAAAARADQALQALAHLSGRLVGERDGQDLPWRHVQILQDVRDAVREHARFA